MSPFARPTDMRRLASLGVLLGVLGLNGCSSIGSPPPPPSDTTPPTAPGGLTATAASSAQINLSWMASTDNVGVTGYQVERCQGAGCSSFVQIAMASGTSLHDAGLTASTSYSYRVRATDAAGNLSNFSGTANATTQTSPDTTPPTAPSNLAATAAGGSQISLSWTASTDNVGVTQYLVERCQGAGCTSFTQVGTSNGTTFNNTELTNATSYSYRVRATDAAGNLSGYSNVVSATTLDTQPPTAPTNLTATAASSVQINLSWTASTDNVGVTQYLVEGCQGAGCTSFTQVGTSTGTTFNNMELTNATSYSYRVRATDAAGNLSGYSNVVSATTLDTQPPTAPTNLTATAASSAQINLSWTASTDNVGVTGYRVERCQGAGCSNFAQITTLSGTTFNDTGLTASTSYSYRVRATDAAGNNSGYSNIASAITQGGSSITVSVSPRRGGLTLSQTLTFTASVTNDVGSAGVTWTKSGGSFSGTPSTTSAKFFSSTAGSFTITATSVADNTKSATVTIGVTDLAGVFTQHYDIGRTGQNQQEYALRGSTVSNSTFGKLFSCPVDGEVYAQPLYVANLAIAGGTHNTIFVATENDSVYAFDADTSPCVQRWTVSLLNGGTAVRVADTGATGSFLKTIGITGTPVIDPASKTLFVVSKTKEGSVYHQRLHALGLTDGSEKFNGPADITAALTVPGNGDTGDATCPSTSGNVPFCPLRENQRPGLLLLAGKVYIAWASHGDRKPYHGWVIGYDASNLSQPPVLFNTTPNGGEGGIWQTGTGPAADASGNIYVITGNGTVDTSTPRTNYGDSFIKLSTTSGLSVADFFTPSNQSILNSGDLDLGSGGPVVLPDSAGSGTLPHLLIGGDKQGILYLIDRDSMTGFQLVDQILQEVTVKGGACSDCGIFSSPAFWQGNLYVVAIEDVLKQYSLSNAILSAAPVQQASDRFGIPGASPAVSSNGTTNGIVWVVNTTNNGTENGKASGPAVLFAYDAISLSKLFSSPATSGAGAAGNAVKFVVPTVANGKVYVGTQTELSVFGLLP